MKWSSCCQLAMMGILLLSMAGVTPVRADEIYFAEPYTGERVTAYQVELYVRQDRKQRFSIPEDCHQIEPMMMGGADQWGSLVNRALWPKVANDCRYHRFVHSMFGTDIQDFVSGYDFLNARIADFPMRWGCDFGVTPRDSNCKPIHYAVPDVSRLPGFERGEPDGEGFSAEACRLENGVFRGRILFGSAGLFCRRDPRGPGFRILSVDFADINSDGYLDAIIRLIPIGARVSRVPVLYVLSKIGEDQPFVSVVDSGL